MFFYQHENRNNMERTDEILFIIFTLLNLSYLHNSVYLLQIRY